ncbi:MAG TPA: DUF2141 domain-containing protein [Candidatus Acidoferrales bacterium]|nr:DUF2141 domain-containing protein [Candidatus Acidoferrales bacterium]
MKKRFHRPASIAVAVAILLAVARVCSAQTPLGAPSAAPTASATPTATPTADTALDIEVIGLRNDSGEVGCSLFDDRAAFPRDDSKVIRHVWAPIHGGKSTCEFIGLPHGEYAAVVFHDENGDHEFNMNAFGLPKEGYGFSNDAAALFSPPDFQAAAFTYSGTRLYLIVNIRY